MFENSRRQFLMGLVVPLTLSACSSGAESEKQARKFIDAYYVRINLTEAQALSTDLAAEKIHDQIQLTSGLGTPQAANAPQVEYKLISEENKNSDAATYIFEVKPQTSDVGGRKVFVKLRAENGQWKVTQFSEGDQQMP